MRSENQTASMATAHLPGVQFFSHAQNVVINGGNFDAVMPSEPYRQADSFKILAEKSSPNAFHNSHAERHRDFCLPGTRTKTQDAIKRWALGEGVDDKPVMLLHGPAGGGKTAVAKSIARRFTEEGLLIGEFFFLRSDGTRNHVQPLAPTIAYQMTTLTWPLARDGVNEVVKNDPHIFSLALETQITRIILKPLDSFRSTNPPHVLIIDGLDECLIDQQGEILQIIPSLCKTFCWLKILIVGRPDPTVRYSFKDQNLANITEQISLADDPAAEGDIRQYLAHRFSHIRATLPVARGEDWPSKADLDLIVRKASDQFILPATVCRYVGSSTQPHRAQSRLNTIVSSLRNRATNGRENPLAEVHALYAFIFSVAHAPSLAVQFAGTCLIYPIFLGAPSPIDVQRILNISEVEAGELLDELASLFEVVDPVSSTSEPSIRPFHASLGDYLFDQSCSKEFWCNEGEVRAHIATARIQQFEVASAISEEDFGVLINILRSAIVTPSLDKGLTGLSELITNAIFRGEHFLERSIHPNTFVNFMKNIPERAPFFSTLMDKIHEAFAARLTSDKRRSPTYDAALACLGCYKPGTSWSPQSCCWEEFAIKLPGGGTPLPSDTFYNAFWEDVTEATKWWTISSQYMPKVSSIVLDQTRVAAAVKICLEAIRKAPRNDKTKVIDLLPTLLDRLESSSEIGALLDELDMVEKHSSYRRCAQKAIDDFRRRNRRNNTLLTGLAALLGFNYRPKSFRRF